MTPRTRLLSSTLLLLSACPSTVDYVCNDIGFCTTASTDQVHACQADATALGEEAYDGGCGPQYDGYFSCANGAYLCTGDTVTFPGCDSARAALDRCLGTERANNSCGALATALAACPAADAGQDLPAPCNASAVCSASCYLASVSQPCAPLPVELSAVGRCTATCP